MTCNDSMSFFPKIKDMNLKMPNLHEKPCSVIVNLTHGQW